MINILDILLDRNNNSLIIVDGKTILKQKAVIFYDERPYFVLKNIKTNTKDVYYVFKDKLFLEKNNSISYQILAIYFYILNDEEDKLKTIIIDLDEFPKTLSFYSVLFKLIKEYKITNHLNCYHYLLEYLTKNRKNLSYLVKKEYMIELKNFSDLSDEDFEKLKKTVLE